MMGLKVLVKRLWPLCLIILVASGLMASVSQASEPADDAKKLRLEIEPLKQIYSNREGLVFKFTFTANEKTKLCLAKDILSQMQIAISRPGKGRLALKPLVIRDNSAIFQQPMKVQWLDSGDSVTLRANLKRYQFVDAEQWTPGEYNVNATFNLCEQTPAEVVTDPGQEIPIRAARQEWFMIMI